MQLHEYQAKEILLRYAIPSPQFSIISSVEEAKQLPIADAVLKVQVHAGGRGKAGGVKRVHTREEMIATAKALLEMKIVNGQTGPQGIQVHQVMVTESVEIHKEYYVAVTIDRKNSCYALIVSQEGGVDIEEVSQNAPQKIHFEKFSKKEPLSEEQYARATQFLGWQLEKAANGKKLIQNIVQAFLENDAELVEINPFVETMQGKFLALDAKMTIDENALFRHPELAALYDAMQLPPLERAARQHDLAFIALDGTIGCMVNGAGLAMATMDLITLKGGKPANFLDVGGGASEEKIIQGFHLLLKDPKVKAIFVNIFGGIMNCATVAKALEKAIKEVSLHVPLVVRVEGTNVEEAKKILKEIQCKMPIEVIDSLDQAAERVVACQYL